MNQSTTKRLARIEQIERQRKKAGVSKRRLSLEAGYSDGWWWLAVNGTSVPAGSSLDDAEKALRRL